MGEVYLAQDTELDRKVALKILPSEVSANRGNRMERLIAKQRRRRPSYHPNIAHVYEIGQSDFRASSSAAWSMLMARRCVNLSTASKLNCLNSCATCNTQRLAWRKLMPQASFIAI